MTYPTHDALIDAMRQHATQEGCDTEGVVFSCSNPHAPLMFVGFQHAEKEKAPFDAPGRCNLTHLLITMKIGPELVYLTDLIKAPLPRRSDFKSGVARWRDFLFDEIDLVHPKAVILLGMDTGRAVLRLDKEDYAKVHGRKFVHPTRTKATFFMTHAPEECQFEGQAMNSRAMEWYSDIRAVCDTDEAYFDKIRIIKD